MSLWGSSNTGSQQEPKFLANACGPYQDMFQRYGQVYADKSGYWLVHPSKGSTVKRELIVAIDRLSDKLGAPIVNELWFGGTDNTGNVIAAPNTTTKINIAYTQQVVITTGTAPTFNLAATGATTGNVVATYSTGNGNNILQFTFATTADFGGLANANTYYVVNDQPIVVGAGLLKGRANTTMNANTLIPTAANTKFPFTNRTPFLRAWDPTAVITGIFFASGNTVARNAASNVFVTFSKAVNVLTTALPNVVLAVVAGNTTNAQYASGNGTANLRFSWTAPQFVANVVTVTPSRTLLVGFINSVSANGAANTFITTAVANAAGNVTPT